MITRVFSLKDLWSCLTELGWGSIACTVAFGNSRRIAVVNVPTEAPQSKIVVVACPDNRWPKQTTRSLVSINGLKEAGILPEQRHCPHIPQARVETVSVATRVGDQRHPHFILPCIQKLVATRFLAAYRSSKPPARLLDKQAQGLCGVGAFIS